ncbi:MAG TPA: hypothetical protein VH280_11150 [Verrucomicrobiae bacterium]|jgi:hypothetical protein|nr:hypothetical protein [Verrucomicrobiae bacterium]
MIELAAFLLPPATALAGMRLSALVLGEKFREQFGFGLRFTLGLAVGMLVFSQAVLLSALAGVNASSILAWLAMIWGIVELALVATKLPAASKGIRFTPAHLWLLLLLPLVYSWWVFGRLSTLEGTLEYDANAFWVFKAKILYLEQGENLIRVLRDVNLGYAHMDYPMLVPSLYTLNYGLVGRVDEFVNKVWPFWMMVALCAGIVSTARLWKNPRPLPIAVVTLIAFLPATLEFIRNEGGTIPMVFYTCTAALFMVSALYARIELAPAALVLVLAGCFSTKFEGVLFTAFTACALLPFTLRQGWLKNAALWKSAAAAFVCIVPYLIYRLSKPVPNSESAWLHTGMETPGAVVHRFPQIWFLNVFARFFNPTFFHWQANNDQLQWIGHWTGLGSLVNDQLAVLPWLLLALLVLSVVYKPRGRAVIGVLSVVVLVTFTVLSVVVSCLKKDDLPSGIDFACSIVGRYYYPFFTAWFLGTAALWFFEEKQTGAPVAEVEADKTAAVLSPRSKRRH